MTNIMLSTHKCIKRGAATLLLLLAASNINIYNNWRSGYFINNSKN